MMNELYILCDNLTNEIGDLNKKGDITPTELDRAYKAIDIIKDIKTIEAMEDAGYSNAGRSYENSYERGRSNMYPGYYYDEPGMNNIRGRNSRDYSEEGSYRRGRDAMGRYTSRDNGYSGHEDEKERMMQQIEDMKLRVQHM